MKTKTVNLATGFHLDNGKSFVCKCGNDIVEHGKSYYEEVWGAPTFIEGEIVCSKCGKLLDYYYYGRYESDEEE